ncbi:MFS transporter, DHA2 family, glioxin efflux transporter, partial [Lecanoromycetidae sp. Uapishka_2]
MAGLFMTVFLIALDRLIIGVAIPKITDDFNSLGDVGWYGSAYLLTSCAFFLFMGRVYTFYDPKWVYLSSLVVFEIGSAVCGAAPNSITFIIGRAIAGSGNAGLVQGALIIIVHIIPLHKRPQYTGFIGAAFALASAISPLLGGAFTDGPGWRWCFYINLPLGGAVLLVHIFFLHIPKENLERKPTTLHEKVVRLDPIGTFFFLPAIICLLLALQWGGIVYSWSNARIIVLLILFGVCFIVFTGVQRWKGENATVPGRIFFNRSILAGASFSFFTGGAMVTLLYFLPVWFQAIKGVTALKSGIILLPLVIGMMTTSIFAGISTKKIGYYAPWMIACSVIMPVGAGLISTFTPTTAHPQWIGYQVLFGLGLGLGQQQASVAAQTVLARKDVPIGAALMMFCQTLGGAVFLSVGNNLFDAKLQCGLASIPGIDIGAVATIGATDLRHMVSAELLPQVLRAYNAALQDTFYLVTALTCATIVGSLTMEWKSVKKEKWQSGSAKSDAEGTQCKEKSEEEV